MGKRAGRGKMDGREQMERSSHVDDQDRAQADAMEAEAAEDRHCFKIKQQGRMAPKPEGGTAGVQRSIH